MKANVKQAVALLNELGIKVSGAPGFNGNNEITFVCLQNGTQLIGQLSQRAEVISDEYGYTTFRCGPGKLVIQSLGMLGCSVTLNNKAPKTKVPVVQVQTSHLPGQMHIDYRIASKLACSVKGATLDKMGNFEIRSMAKFEQSLLDLGFRKITVANSGFTEPAWVKGRTLIHFSQRGVLGFVSQLVKPVSAASSDDDAWAKVPRTASTVRIRC